MVIGISIPDNVSSMRVVGPLQVAGPVPGGEPGEERSGGPGEPAGVDREVSSIESCLPDLHEDV